MSFLQRTAVVIPALNEALCVGETVRAWQALGVRLVRVVDNGSHDDTARVAQAAGAEVLSERQRGYGAAVWRGVQDLPSDLEWVLFSSADGSDQLGTEELSAWTRAAEANDLVVGDRVTSAASREHLKAVQGFGNRLCCWLIALGWRRRFADMGSLRVVKVNSLRTLALKDRGFGWNVEMQVRAIEHGMRITELPVNYHPRRAGESKISGNLLGTIRAARGILGMMFHLWRTRRRS